MPPKKPPDRDVLVPKTRPTPAEGVPAQRLGSDVEWAGDTGAHALTGNEGVDDDTPVGLETLDALAETRMRARVKKTNDVVLKLTDTAEATNAGIDTWRGEAKRDVLRLENKVGLVSAELTKVNIKVDKLGERSDEKFDRLHEKIDGQTTATFELVGTVGELKGALTEMVKTNDQRREIETVTHASRIDVDRVERIMDIKDEADATKQKRSFKYKLGGVALKILGAVALLAATALVTHFIEHC